MGDAGVAQGMGRPVDFRKQILEVTAMRYVVDRGEGEERKLTFGMFIAVYLGTMIFGFGISVVLNLMCDVDLERAVLGYAGALFALAAARRPHLLFEVLRSTGWFALITSDWVMRVLLAVIAVFAATGALGIWASH